MMNSIYKKITLLVFLSALLAVHVATAQYTKLHDFEGIANGQQPYSSLISDGTFLYGVTPYGGDNNNGVIFKMMPDGTEYTVIHEFSDASDGRYPFGSLVSDGTFLYGMTQSGGDDFDGTLFKVMPDGSGFVKLLDFTGLTTGRSPYGPLFYDGTFLYGMTQYGGSQGMGVLFRMLPDGSEFSLLLEFDGVDKGKEPHGSLISVGNFLYGMTTYGGTSNYGTLFRIMPDGGGYEKILDFNGFLNGSLPFGSLITDGTYLYGITGNGGSNGLGVVFKMMPDGTEFTKLLDFAGASNGSLPYGSIILEEDYIYGMTWQGGTNNLGTIFKLQTDGTAYTKLLDFDGETNGSNPWGNLLWNGNLLYGMTEGGGTNDLGTIFKIEPSPIGVAEGRLVEPFSIYPNPNNGLFTIQSSEKNFDVSIVNVLGEVVHASTRNAAYSTIDLSSQAKGIYFARIYGGQTLYTIKMVVH